METRRIEVIKPIIENKTTIRINFGCSTKYKDSVISEIDLEFAKKRLNCLTLKKVRKIIFQCLDNH